MSDRSTVVAELHEPGATYRTVESGDPIPGEWIAGGLIIPPAGKKGPLPVSPVRMREGLALDLLDADRGEQT